MLLLLSQTRHRPEYAFQQVASQAHLCTSYLVFPQRLPRPDGCKASWAGGCHRPGGTHSSHPQCCSAAPSTWHTVRKPDRYSLQFSCSGLTVHVPHTFNFVLLPKLHGAQSGNQMGSHYHLLLNTQNLSSTQLFQRQLKLLALKTISLLLISMWKKTPLKDKTKKGCARGFAFTARHTQNPTYHYLHPEVLVQSTSDHAALKKHNNTLMVPSADFEVHVLSPVLQLSPLQWLHMEVRPSYLQSKICLQLTIHASHESMAFVSAKYHIYS